jgi:imidazolonepropionase-like amidohydrolase
MTRLGLVLFSAVLLPAAASAQIAVRGETVYTMAGAPIKDGVVLMRGGKIERVGPASQVTIPSGYRTLTAKVVTPGLVDAHTVVGLSGLLNSPVDQDQVERSAPVQPELRAIDSYNAQEPLVEYVRSYGVTTMHTGHGPGILLSGQTAIVKTTGKTMDDALVSPVAMIAVTLGEGARESGGKSPGTRSKAVAMLRSELIKAQEYAQKWEKTEKGKEPARDLRLEALARVTKRELPLLVTVNRANDILTALRVGKEFNLRMVLDGGAEAHAVLDQIKASGYPVILHPPMQHAYGDMENLSFETASKLKAAGIPFALQSGFESYVPKTRVVLFEAGVAAANGLSFEDALRSVTIDAARILGIEGRVGSLEEGKDADLAMYDGDPFEYATHCTGVVVNGALASETKR